MKSSSSRGTRRVCGLALLAFLVFLAGCVTRRIVWSPDGKWAAVLGEKGLYLSDAEGKISGMLAPDIARVDWFPDSRRLALVRSRKLNTWGDVKPWVSAEEQQRLAAAAKVVLQELDAGHDINAALAATKTPDGAGKGLLGVYLKADEAVRKKAGVDDKTLEGLDVTVSELTVATVADGALTPGPVLASLIGATAELRVSPGGRFVAFVAEPLVESAQTEYVLRVAPADGSKPALVVAEHAGASLDWSTDGRTLFYIKPADVRANGDEFVLASVARQRVVNDQGALDLQTPPDELAGLVFEPETRLRCLPDGRILFSAIELRLPAATADMPQTQQLFALDPERQATLTPLIPQNARADLPESLMMFEPSPDGRRVSFLGKKQVVSVLTLATGKVERVQASTDSGGEGSEPVWRSANELCFVASPTNGGPSQVCLWTNGVSRPLSAAWPVELRQGLLD